MESLDISSGYGKIKAKLQRDFRDLIQDSDLQNRKIAIYGTFGNFLAILRDAQYTCSNRHVISNLIPLEVRSSFWPINLSEEGRITFHEIEKAGIPYDWIKRKINSIVRKVIERNLTAEEFGLWFTRDHASLTINQESLRIANVLKQQYELMQGVLK